MMAEKQKITEEIKQADAQEVSTLEPPQITLRSIIGAPCNDDVKYIDGVTHRKDKAGNWRPVISIDVNDT